MQSTIDPERCPKDNWVSFTIREITITRKKHIYLRGYPVPLLLPVPELFGLFLLGRPLFTKSTLKLMRTPAMIKLFQAEFPTFRTSDAHLPACGYTCLKYL